jgi:hypothetical protein
VTPAAQEKSLKERWPTMNNDGGLSMQDAEECKIQWLPNDTADAKSEQMK